MRYLRQTVLKHIGKRGQELLAKSKAVVVGCGATGSRAAELLTRAGLGNLVLIDRDIVEISNLQSNALFTEADIGCAKAVVAKKALEAINSETKIVAYPVDLSSENVSLLSSDIVLDCTDNLQTRFLINEYCKKQGLPWVFSAVTATRGFVMAFQPSMKACFRCIFKMAEGLETCETAGILNTVPTAIVSVQVTEALKILTKQKDVKGLLHIDLWKQTFERLKIRANRNCPVCKGKYEMLGGKTSETLRFCGSGTYQIKGFFDYNRVKERLSRVGHIVDMGYCFRFGAITVFKDRVLLKAKDETEARILYSKLIGD